jgi:hypothetical protein
MGWKLETGLLHQHTVNKLGQRFFCPKTPSGRLDMFKTLFLEKRPWAEETDALYRARKKKFCEKRKNTHRKHSKLRITLKRGILEC